MKKIILILVFLLNGITLFGQNRTEYDIIQDLVQWTAGDDFYRETKNGGHESAEFYANNLGIEYNYYRNDNSIQSNSRTFSFKGIINWDDVSSASISWEPGKPEEKWLTIYLLQACKNYPLTYFDDEGNEGHYFLEKLVFYIYPNSRFQITTYENIRKLINELGSINKSTK